MDWQPGKPLLMGIVNTTPDSFSDGGDYNTPALAIEHAATLLKQGADILDVGGESTRPGAQPVDVYTEWARVGPVLKELLTWNVPVSIDTMKPEIMSLAVQEGVDILNDVNAFQAEGALDILAGCSAGAIIMHRQGESATMQKNPEYHDVCAQVRDFLTNRLAMLQNAGVSHERILVDPGFGFGKTLEHNIALLQYTSQLAILGAGVLIGVSRKRMIAQLTDPLCQQLDAKDRVSGSVAAALYAANQGAAVIRVHDVRATVDALKVWGALAL